MTIIIIIIIIVIIVIIISLTLHSNKLVCRGFYHDTTHVLAPSCMDHKQFKSRIANILVERSY